MLKLDGPEGSYEAWIFLYPKWNITLVDTGGDLINVDNNSIVALSNLYFTDIQGIHQCHFRTTAPSVSFANIDFRC
jgi:hypothetical protein